MKKIFITGGGGYVGTRLVQVLLKKNYFITVYDLFFYGNYLPKNKNLKVVYGDIRDTKKLKEIIKIKDLRDKLEYKKICVIGLGHVGLPLAVHIANKSIAVIGYDIDKKKINLIKKKSPFYEKDLDELRKHTV